jgi:hypothetical protein
LPLGQPVDHFGYTLTYRGKDHSDPSGKTPYHVLVEKSGSESAFIASPRQFQLPGGKGLMRKPAVKKLWNKDLYISPLDEVGGDEAGMTQVLPTEQTTNVGNFTMTFLGFEMEGHEEGAFTQVNCPIEVMGDMYFDTLTPGLTSTAQGLAEVPVEIGDGRYTLSVERIDAGGGAIEVRLIDHQVDQASVPVFWIEFAEKPLINLFWGGTWLLVIGGILAMFKRAGQLDGSDNKTARESRERAAGVTDSAETPRRSELTTATKT